MDKDSIVLQNAANAVTAIDLRYRQGDLDLKRQLKGPRDAAYEQYTKARVELLKDGVICNDQDLTEISSIREAIEEAAGTQQLLTGIGRFVVFLARVSGGGTFGAAVANALGRS